MSPGLKDIELDKFLSYSEGISRFIYCLDQMIVFISSEEMFNSIIIQNVVNRIKVELLS